VLVLDSTGATEDSAARRVLARLAPADGLGGAT
jgi:hypothetical protein